MNTSAGVIKKRWHAVMRDRWKDFSRGWTRVRHHSSPRAVHDMRSASRRLTSSIAVAASAGVRGDAATRRLERLSSRLGPLRDNAVYRKTLDRLKTSGKVRSFSRFLADRKSDEHDRLDKFFGRHTKRAIHRRIDAMERKLQRLSKHWTASDYFDAFENVLRRQYEALMHAHKGWEDSPDSRRFHRVRVELRELRYAGETIAEVLGLTRSRDIQSTLRKLKSLQTNMGDIHDLHKLRTELVAWISKRPEKKRARQMTAASEMHEEMQRRMVEFKDHTLVSRELLPHLPVPGAVPSARTGAMNSKTPAAI
jgi:CHAD domain-containing protein